MSNESKRTPYTTEKARQQMGLSKALCDPKTIFARKFRWTLTAEHWPDLEYWVNKVHVSFLAQSLTVSIMVAFTDKQDTPLYPWLSDIVSKVRSKPEKMVLTTFDGCGNALEQFEFFVDGADCHTMDLDYSCSDVLAPTIRFTFRKYTRRCCVGCEAMNGIEDRPLTKLHRWTYTFKDSSGKEIEEDVRIEKRPTLDIEETEVCHLNAKMFLPGQATWEELIISPVQVYNQWIDFIIPGEHKLTLYENDKPIECWKLNTTDIRKSDAWHLAIRYRDAWYENLNVPKTDN